MRRARRRPCRGTGKKLAELARWYGSSHGLRAWLILKDTDDIARRTGQPGIDWDNLPDHVHQPPIIHPDLIEAHRLYTVLGACVYPVFSGVSIPNWSGVEAKLRLLGDDPHPEDLELMDDLWTRIRAIAGGEVEAKRQADQAAARAR